VERRCSRRRSYEIGGRRRGTLLTRRGSPHQDDARGRCGAHRGRDAATTKRRRRTDLDLVAVSYSLGLAAAVLYLGAVGDRYGRKLMFLGGLIAARYPQYSAQITAAAKSSFLDGANWAYGAGVIAILIGAALVAFCFPRHEEEQRLLAEYHAIDTAAETDAVAPSGAAPP
jgi:hypothetical protein